MFKPATFATPEDRIAAEVEAVEIELRRVEQRLRTIGWSTPPPRRLSMAEEWAVTAGTLDMPDYGEGDAIVGRVLEAKRSALLEELRRLRQQLTGQAGGERRGKWG